MEEEEDLLDYLGRVDKEADELAMLECSKSDEEVNQHTIQNLSPLYTIQKTSNYLSSRYPLPRNRRDHS